MDNITLNRKIANYIDNESNTTKSYLTMSKEILQIIEEEINKSLSKLSHRPGDDYWDFYREGVLDSQNIIKDIFGVIE